MHVANGLISGNDQLAAWLAQRCGKLTGSRAGAAFAQLKSGAWAKSRYDYIRDILAERLTGLSVRHFVSEAMQHGLDTEPEAKAEYETITGNIIADCGFYDHPDIDMFGSTPDGLLEGGGVLEVKCPTTPVFVEWLRIKGIPEEHEPQLLCELACTGRQWVDFVAYDPRILDQNRRIIIRRYIPTPEMIAAVEDKARAFLAEVDTAWEELTTMPA